MGVATGKKVNADILPGTKTDLQVIDIDDKKVIGTKEGVAYITATYQAVGQNKPYTSSSMKIILSPIYRLVIFFFGCFPTSE